MHACTTTLYRTGVSLHQKNQLTNNAGNPIRKSAQRHADCTCTAVTKVTGVVVAVTGVVVAVDEMHRN